MSIFLLRDGSFAVTAAFLWNNLLRLVTTSPVSNVYRRHISFIWYISVIQNEHEFLCYIICYYYQYIIIHLFIGIIVM